MRLAAATLLSALLVLGAGSAQAVPGNLDPSFGSGGVATTRIGGSASAQGLVLQPDGKIVEAGWSLDGSDGVFALARYAADGSLDRAIRQERHDDHRVGHALPGAGARAPARRQDRRGRADLLPGEVRAREVQARRVARSDLRREREADVPGRGRERRGGGRGPARRQDRRRRLQLGRHGLRGRARPAEAERIAGSRVRHGRDHDHGDRLSTRPPKRSSCNRTGRSSSPAPAPSAAVFTRATLVRYGAGGALDAGFGSGGIATLAGSPNNADAHALALQPDGKIVVAGNDSGRGLLLARYTANGALDQGFGSGGSVLTRLEGSSEATAVAIQPDGKIVAAGRTRDGAVYTYAVARYDAAGSLDPSFGRARRGRDEARPAPEGRQRDGRRRRSSRPTARSWSAGRSSS